MKIIEAVFESDTPADRWMWQVVTFLQSFIANITNNYTVCLFFVPGTFCVLGSFPFIFLPCMNCEGSHQWAQILYYSAFVIIFQFGWASVQISHLSMIPDLTPNEHERTELTAIR